MGAGQSKFGKGNHQTHYPYGAPGYVPPYPPQPPFIPAYGPQAFPPGPAGYPQQPPGFVPPGIYGQGANLPPPQLNWLPQDRRRSRKSRRTQSERFVGGFAGEAPQSSVQPRRHSESRRRASEGAPVMPQPSTGHNPAEAGPSRRAPTPFIPPLGTHEDDSSDEEDDEEDRPRGPPTDIGRNASHRSRVRYPSPPPVDADIENVLRPMEPASSSAFGPRGQRPLTPLKNPLPPPPRDLYEMTPYKSLLSLPQTTALLTATYGPQHLSDTGAAQLGLQPTIKRKKSAKGLFRAFSKRDKNKEPEQPRVQFIPVFVPKNEQSSSNTQLNDLSRSMSQQSRRPPSIIPPAPNGMPAQPPSANAFPTASTAPPTGVNFNPGPTPSSSATPRPGVPPVPPIPSSPPAIRFDQESLPFSAFLNHSPHRILYRNVIYPSALHLYEAMKFIDQHPHVAEIIRNVPSVQDVYPTAANFQHLQRADWGTVFLQKMEEVLWLKVTQHPDLRQLLLDTGDARIIYTDPNDTYWGSGLQGEGNNELGKTLVRVRERLRQHAY